MATPGPGGLAAGRLAVRLGSPTVRSAAFETVRPVGVSPPWAGKSAMIPPRVVPRSASEKGFHSCCDDGCSLVQVRVGDYIGWECSLAFVRRW